MNYYPYFRGKQYELICLREQAELIAACEFTPIIEPVKENWSGLLRAIAALMGAGVKFRIVANPTVGDHVGGLDKSLRKAIQKEAGEYAGFGWIFQISSDQDLLAFDAWLKDRSKITVLHQNRGDVSSKDVLAILAHRRIEAEAHVFCAGTSTRYRTAFSGTFRVLLDDGFKKQKNADYAEVEIFSELPATYKDRGMDGFGDYLIVGNEYSEGGGAAYAVAIHITFADPDEDGVIYVRHFVSDTNNTPVDPAGKFREALEKLVAHCDSRFSKIPRTKAIEEFRRLRVQGHFPGLGYVKKLCMQHHLEMMGG